jgi:hypothetical protein
LSRLPARTAALALLLVFLPVVAAPLPRPRLGDDVGNWSGSSRSWNQGEFTGVKKMAENAGHKVRPDGPINAKDLFACRVFIIGEPGQPPSQTELADLKNWVQSGGRLILLCDSGSSGVAGNNAILAHLGSSMKFADPNPDNAPIKPGCFASEGPPYNLVNQNLAITPGSAANGGNEMAGTYIRWEKIGQGFVFCFADRSDHDFFQPSDQNVNGRIFLNILARPGSQPMKSP